MSDKTIFIVTAGCYSDYRILAVFDDLQLAEAFVQQYPAEPGTSTYKPTPAIIENWPLNPNQNMIKEGMIYWRITVKKNGDVSRCEPQVPPMDNMNPITQADIKRPFKAEPFLYVYCWAKDENHAIKIATEKKQEVDATEMWDEK